VFTNNSNVPLPLAVWLAAPGDYDLEPSPTTISATSLLLPVRSLVLSRRVEEKAQNDLLDFVKSKLGTAVHANAEVAWLKKYRAAFQALGYNEQFINRVLINPSPEMIQEDSIPIYVEQRTNRKLEGFTVSGKFDFVVDGCPHDIKTTSTYTYIKGTNDHKYRMQGSIYRWLNPEIITGEHVFINYLFTDWSPLKAKADPHTYPQSPVLSKSLPLYGMQDTENYIRGVITNIKKYEDTDQRDLPHCNKEELWMDDPTFAVYNNPNKTNRASRVFDTQQEAMIYNAEKNQGKGLMVARKSEPKFCRYCNARPICSQAEAYVLEGILEG